MKQMGLFGYEEEFDQTDDGELQQKFLRFHWRNPHVHDKIKKCIDDVRRIGYNRYTISGIFEQIRWHDNIQTQDRQYKLSNSYRSRYVRLIEEQEPELVGFFEKKKLTSR